MGLWLKCPGCQIRNPLSARVCLQCGQSLDNLPREARVYVIGAPETAAPPAHPAHRPAAGIPVAAAAPAAKAKEAAPPAPKAAKAPKKPRKKKG